MDQLTLVEQAYWDLAFAVRNLDVLNNALGAGAGAGREQRAAGQGRERWRPSTSSKRRRRYRDFEQAVASGQQSLTEAENRLKRLMLANRGAAGWNQPLRPGQTSPSAPSPTLPLDEAVKLALTRRPELRALDSTARAERDRPDLLQGSDQAAAQSRRRLYAVRPRRRSAVEQQRAAGRRRRRPGRGAARRALNELSLLASLTPLTTPPPAPAAGVPPFFVGGYGTSLSNLFARRFPTALVQVQMDLPLRNRTARANLARAEIAATQIERRRQAARAGDRERSPRRDAGGQLVGTAASRRRRRSAATRCEQYESERRRFDSGLSTVFLVLERQTAFVTAQALELRASADLNQAIAQLERAIGGTLEWHGVKYS